MADVAALRDALSEKVLLLHQEAMQVCLDATLAAAPERTGALKHLTDVTPSTILNGDFVATGQIFSLAPYAGYTDEGTVPHLIVGNPLLHFYWDEAGKWMTLPYVNHPGSPGTQWFNGGEADGEPMASRWQDACEQVALT